MKAAPLRPEAYRPYGDVVAARADVRPRSANMGTADRFNWLADLEDRRPGKAKPNLCVFHCRPQVRRGQRVFRARILEKHPESTQVFVPLGAAGTFLVLVCLGGDAPDLSTFKAFLVSGARGVTYRPGVWHHPLVAVGKTQDFACLVWEDGTSRDTSVVKLARALDVEIPR